MQQKKKQNKRTGITYNADATITAPNTTTDTVTST